MDITKAKKLVELEKDGRKILVTLYEGGQVSSCVEEEDQRYCETCQADDVLCQEYIEDMVNRGYQATEIELGELQLEETLPRFLAERQGHIAPLEEVESEPTEVAEPEISEDAVTPADQNLP